MNAFYVPEYHKNQVNGVCVTNFLFTHLPRLHRIPILTVFPYLKLRPIASMRKMKVWTNYYLRSKGWEPRAKRDAMHKVAREYKAKETAPEPAGEEALSHSSERVSEL